MTTATAQLREFIRAWPITPTQGAVGLFEPEASG
jgi:hypothetical protein